MIPPIPQVISHNTTIYNFIMQKIMLIIMSLIYYHPTFIIQKILKYIYHPTLKQTRHPTVTNHQQQRQHQPPTITTNPTTYSYKLIWQYLKVIFFNFHRQPTSTSDAQGSSLATAWRNQRPTLHQHKPPKQGCSLASVVSQQSPTLHNKPDHQQPSMWTPSWHVGEWYLHIQLITHLCSLINTPSM